MEGWTGIGVAVIGALAGIGGAFLGAAVASRTTSREADKAREEARAVMFADRIRELGALVLDGTYRFTEAVNEHMDTAHLGEDIPRHIRELRLIVRLEPTGKALDALMSALILLEATLPGAEFQGDHKLRRSQITESRELQHKLEDALRAELELPPAPTSWFDW